MQQISNRNMFSFFDGVEAKFALGCIDFSFYFIHLLILYTSIGWIRKTVFYYKIMLAL